MRRRRGTRTERGAAAVEFALVMLPLVALLFGAIQYGLYFWAMQGGSDIARTAARSSAVGDPATGTCDELRAAGREQISGLTGSAASATIPRHFVDAQSPADGLTVGDKVEIQVSFKSADMHFPLVPFVHDGLVSSTADSRVDF